MVSSCEISVIVLRVCPEMLLRAPLPFHGRGIVPRPGQPAIASSVTGQSVTGQSVPRAFRAGRFRESRPA